MTDWSKVQLGTLPVSTRTGAVQTPPAVELTPTGYVEGGGNFFIPTNRPPSVEGGSTGYTGPELKGGVCAAKFLVTA